MIKNLIAQSTIPLAPSGGFGGFGEFGNPEKDTFLTSFTKFISTAIGTITIVGILWFVFVFITGAIAWIGAGGDKGKIEAARHRITSGIVGLVVLIVALFVVNLIGYILGLEEILDLESLFNTITGATQGSTP